MAPLFYDESVESIYVTDCYNYLAAGYVSLYMALMADIIPAGKVEHGSGLLLTFFGFAVMLATPFAGKSSMFVINEFLPANNNFATCFN